jgi:serine/threonine protein kinase
VDKRYRVLTRIGSGGMGLVYRVEHIQLGKIAAMKVLHADTARDAEAVRRFRTEAQAVSRLSHPNIVQTFDFGQSEGALYLVMEYVRGEDLAAIVQRDGPLPFERAAPLFVQICSALTDAHESGVIHRDLKPENIVVVQRRGEMAHAKVLDFGLAKLRERTDGADVTSGGQVIGTPYYMSPEQVRSEPLDVRTDVYSLGATLYRVLTGTPPFQAPTPVGVLTKHITDPLEPPRVRAPELNLPKEADAIVARAMAKSREDRYASAAEVQRDLEAAMAALSAVRPKAPSPDLISTVRPGNRDGSTARAATVASPQQSTATASDVDRGESSFSDEGRLRRQEFDEFERSLRRKKLVASLVFPVGVVAIVVAVVVGIGRSREKASNAEREPNNDARDATLLPLDGLVEGHIGSRLSGGEPDLDYFRVPSGKGDRAVSARVQGIPDIDLVLELFDAQGAALAKSDSRGNGGGEWLQPVGIGAGEAYLLIRQVWIQGTPPVENAPDPYRLTVHWAAPTPGWESEPNDWQDRANALQVGAAIKGYLGTATDKDWFAIVSPTAGSISVRFVPPPGVEVSLLVGDGPAPKADKTGAIRLSIKAGVRTLIGIERKVAPNADVKAEGLMGLDDPYEFKVDGR